MGAERQGSIEALVFDMDGLLFDSERVVQRTWNMAGEELGAGQVGEQIYHTLGMNLKSRTEFFHRVFGPDFPMEEFAETDETVLQADRGDGGRASEAGSPGAPLLRKGERIQNGGGHLLQEGALHLHAEAGRDLLLFRRIYVRRYGGERQAGPGDLPEGLRLLGTAPERSMALEDSPNGIRSASAAGMTAVMVPDLVQPDEELKRLAFRVCRDLTEVMGLLEG